MAQAREHSNKKVIVTSDVRQVPGVEAGDGRRLLLHRGRHRDQHRGLVQKDEESLDPAIQLGHELQLTGALHLEEVVDGAVD